MSIDGIHYVGLYLTLLSVRVLMVRDQYRDMAIKSFLPR